jgi:ABC-type transporter Mla MlaB component
MLITVSQEQGQTPVSVLHLHGDLDSSNYTDVIKKAQELFKDGARQLVIDLEKVPFMSSAGLMALHTIALLFRGDTPPADAPAGKSYRSIDPERDRDIPKHVKLLYPQEPVDHVLETVGLKQFFQTFTDLTAAVNSF